MTTNGDFKTLVRARMHKTGETYSAARRHLLGQRSEAPSLLEAVQQGNLERALVALSLEGQPRARVWTVWATIDRLTDKARASLKERNVASLLRFVYRDQGFRAPADYDDPRSVQIDRVIVRKKGTPAALAALLLLLADRLAIPLWPVAFPGHFLVRDEDGHLYDPASGSELPRAPLAALAKESFPELASTALEPCDTRALIVRLLENRLSALTRRGDTGGALVASDHLLTLTEAPDARLRRGVLLWALGAPRAGREEVLSALELPADPAGVFS